MMGIDNPPGWFSEMIGLGDTSKYKFFDDDHVNIHDTDMYYLKKIDSVTLCLFEVVLVRC